MLRVKPINWSEGDRGCFWAYTITGHYVIEKIWGQWRVIGAAAHDSLDLAKEYCQKRHETTLLREFEDV